MEEWMKKLDEFFTKLFVEKAPKLSEKGKGWIVKILPWLTLILGLVALPAILAGLGLGAIVTPFLILGGGTKHLGWSFLFLISAIQTIMELVAVPGLFKKSKKGWQLLYWANLLGLASSVLSFSGMGLVITAVSLYLLYQIKNNYR